VVEGLLLGWAEGLGDGLVPLLAVRELRVDVEDHAAEVEDLVANDIADAKARMRHVDLAVHGGRTFERFKRRHASYLGKAEGHC
jgi:hypothetical protein